MASSASSCASVEWRKLPVSLSELCINTTLRCGQSFRWRRSGADEWSCALHGRLLTLRQDSTYLHYRSIFPAPPAPSTTNAAQRPLPTKSKSKRSLALHAALPTPPPSSPASISSTTRESTIAATDDGTLDLLKHYLNLKPNLETLYEEWSAKDPNFRKRVSADMTNLQGIRVLKQDPWEALCGFICSSNNNIKRISLMMNRLCTHYGRFIADLEEEVIDLDAGDDDIENVPPKSTGRAQQDLKPKMKKIKIPYHDFPPPEALTGPDVEGTLRELGFGYRAKYIYQTACMVVHEKGGLSWLESLMNPEAKDDKLSSTDKSSQQVMPPNGREGYRHAHEQLLQLSGVGPKVADCVCQMGLGWGESVPVDTHVWQIAVRDYKFGGKGGKNATMTKALYDAVGDKFRQLWGTEAGWAHSVLFTADLSDFKTRVTKVEVREKVIDEDGTVMVKQEEVLDVDQFGSQSEVKSGEPNSAVLNGSGRGKRTRKPLQVKRDVVVEKMVKRPFEDVETKVVEVHEDMMSRVKRRREGRS